MNTHIDSEFDQRLADWLEEDPTIAPREVLGTVLAAYPSIPQRRASRAPWRLQRMNPIMRLAAVAAVAVVAVAGAAYLLKLPAAQVGGPPTGPATVEGVWEVTFTHDEMLAAGLLDSSEDTPANYGHFKLDLHGGFWQLTQLDGPKATDSGQYKVLGDTFRFSQNSRDDMDMPFTVTATTLTIGRGGPVYLHVKPWTRIGP